MINSQHLRRFFCRTRHALFLALAIGPTVGASHEYYGGDFTLIHPWADATAAGQLATAPVYFTMESVRSKDRLVRASTPLAGRVEFRSGSTPSAKALKAIEIEPADKLDFGKDRPHLVLHDLKAPLQWGRSYEMTLVFEKSGPIQVMVSVGSH